MLVISHDRYFLDNVATRIVELDNGTLTEYLGNYTYYVEERQRVKHAIELPVDEEEEEYATKTRALKKTRGR